MSDAEDSDQSVREIVREELQKQRVSMHRRSFLATLAGAAGVGAAGYHMVRPAQASSHSGLVGSQNNLARIWAETIRDGSNNVVLDVANSTLDITDLLIDGVASPTFASNTDDNTDVTVHSTINSPTSATDISLFDVSDGPKTLIGGHIVGRGQIQNQSGNGDRIGPVNIDGTDQTDYPTAGNNLFQDASGDNNNFIELIPVIYDSSMSVKYKHGGTGNRVRGIAYVKGSGPHTAAIVQDGEPVYSVHRNLNDDQIAALNAPDGYEVVKNPDLDHRDPQVRGAWDAEMQTVVDHPYWARFYDALENIRTLTAQHGPRELLKNVDTPADRGTIPVDTPDPSAGTADPDPSVTSHIKEDAIAFEKSRWDEQLPDSI